MMKWWRHGTNGVLNFGCVFLAGEHHNYGAMMETWYNLGQMYFELLFVNNMVITYQFCKYKNLNNDLF